MIDRLEAFWTDERGVAMTEYALILALVSIGLLLVLVIFRDAIGLVFDKVAGFLVTETEGAHGGYQPSGS